MTKEFAAKENYENNSRQPKLNAQEPSFFAGGDGEKIVYIGEQNGVDASGAVVGDDLESQTGIGDKTAD